MEVTFKKVKLLGLIPVSMADTERVRLGDDELIFDFEAKRVYLSSNESEDFAIIRRFNKKSVWKFQGEIQTVDGDVILKRNRWWWSPVYHIFGKKYDEYSMRDHFDFRYKYWFHGATSDIRIKKEEGWRAVVILAAMMLIDAYEFSSSP